MRPGAGLEPATSIPLMGSARLQLSFPSMKTGPELEPDDAGFLNQLYNELCLQSG